MALLLLDSEAKSDQQSGAATVLSVSSVSSAHVLDLVLVLVLVLVLGQSLQLPSGSRVGLLGQGLGTQHNLRGPCKRN